jgi:hypothetical protein
MRPAVFAIVCGRTSGAAGIASAMPEEACAQKKREGAYRTGPGAAVDNPRVL